MYSMCHWTTKSSSTFESHAVRVTGGRSLSQATGEVLDIGDIWTSLYAEGKSVDDNDWLKIVVTGSESSNAKSFRIASGPQTLKGFSLSSFL